MDASATTPLAAFVAGLVTSVHCTAMCGPLACAMRVRPLEYHSSRLVSYGLAGAGCGAVGQAVALFLQGATARVVPWAFAVVLVALALGLERRLPQPQWVTRLLVRARLNRSLGWLTPLLPCGPLWLMLGMAALTGTWWGGAALMATFAAGTIPLPLLVQTQALRLGRVISPPNMRRCQQMLAFTAAGLMVWRAMLPLHDCCCH